MTNLLFFPLATVLLPFGMFLCYFWLS
jgi:hypothetical protein